MSVRQALGLVVALFTLTFLIACGSSSPHGQPPPSGGFSDSNLNGTYVIAISGFEISSTGTEAPFALAGTITASGSGSLSGTIDLNDPLLASEFSSSTLVQTGISVTGNYKVGADGRGTGTLSFTFDGSSVQFGLDFVITQNGLGLISRFDRGGSGSGTLDLQTSASQGSLSSVAFTLSGVDSAGNSLATVGAGTLDTTTGAFTSGSEDFNDGRSSIGLTDLPLSGSVLIASGTSGTAALDSSFGGLGFDVWVIDQSHFKLIETDPNGAVLSGDAYSQATSVSAGNLAYTLAGFDGVGSGNPVSAGGLLAVDSSGNISGIEDFVDSGTSTSGTQTITSGNCTLSAGRCLIVPGGFSNGSLGTFQFAAYPSSNGILLLEVDGLGQMLGAAYAQSVTSLSTPQGYGMNITGFDLSSGFEVDDIAEFTAQNVGSGGTGAMAGVIDINDGGPQSSQSLNGSTFTPDSPADGRGSISTLTAPAAMEYYTVDGNNVLLQESDGLQIAIGTLQLQNASTSPSAIGPAMNLVRLASRNHGAWKQSKKVTKK